MLTAVSLLVHGYHPFAEDAEIYLPGVEKILNPRLFPIDREFFASHASLTIFPNLIAFSLRVTHLSFEAGLFLWYVASIFLFLFACWELSGLLFSSDRARWGAVGMVAALLTIPVAGTALYIMDQYLNPRNLTAFAGIFAVAQTLKRKYIWAGLWLVFAGSVHPLMGAFAFSCCVLLVLMARFERKPESQEYSRSAAVPGCLIPFTHFLVAPTSQAYHEAAMRHGFHYIQLWRWYEVIGAIAPVLLFWWFERLASARHWQQLSRLCQALIIYNVVYFCAALVVDIPARFESLARLQPLRSLHLLYILMFVIVGGLAGEYLLKRCVWRWAALFVSLSAGMFFAQRALFPASSHIEWPDAAPKNPWSQAFAWVRHNTPIDAVFALDPLFMQIPGEDAVGFRCRAERSRLADAIKDSGAVSMFPPLADEWWAQVQAETPWKNLRLEDFARLKQSYGVGWLVLQQPGVPGLDCVYQNGAVKVCQVP